MSRIHSGFFLCFFEYRTKITREMLIDVEYVINEINIINETS